MFSFFTRSKKRLTAARPSRRPSYRPMLEALEDRCLLSSGALDPTFGSGGIVTTALSKTGDIAHGVLLQSNGDLIAYGDADTGTNSSPDVASFGLARYTAQRQPGYDLRHEGCSDNLQGRRHCGHSGGWPESQ